MLVADDKAGGGSGNGDADASKDRPRVRDSLFSPSASSSSSVDGENERENAEENDEEHAQAQPTKAPLFPSGIPRAGSMLGANPRSRSANANSKKQFGDVRRRTMFPASSSFTLGSTTPSSPSIGSATIYVHDNLSSSAVFPERRGLFEADDEAESLESFQERVKMRQSKKKSEMDALRGQFEAAQQRVDQLEAQVVGEAKEKQEFEIRMKECQRIIEKRNKQLMKASERMARFTEQSESQSAELQAKVAALTAENSQLRAEMAVNIEQARADAEHRLNAQQADFASKMKQHERHMQSKLERAVEIAEQGVEAKLAENLALRRKIQELEAELEAATAAANKAKAEAETATAAATAAASLSPSRIKQSEKYQALLKQVENTEAISRGLRYQLEKEREEKKYLKQQLSAVQSSGTTVAGFFDGDAAASKSNASPTSSAASAADLASFDFTAAPAGAAEGGSAPPSPANARQRSRSQSRSRSGSSGLFSSNPFGIGKHTETADEAGDDTVAPQDFESKRKKRGSSTSSLQTPLESFPQESTDETSSSPATATQKSVASSVNFFEKFSIKFKRSSSPRNSATAGSTRTEDSAGPAPTQPTVNTAVTSPAAPSATGSSVVSPLPLSAVSGRRKVLNERPRMYVARSPSHHEEESSDSIFGSESDSSSSFDSDGETPPLPPPPPTQDVSPPRAAAVHGVPVPIPPQLVQVDAGAEADSSDSEESSSSDESDDEPSRPVATGIPAVVPAPSVTGMATTAAQDQTRPQVPPAAPGVGSTPLESDESSSSDLSDDSSSDEDEGGARIDRTGGKPSPVATPLQPRRQERTTRSKSERSSSSSSESSSSSSSDGEVERLSSKRRSRGRAEEAAADSKSSRKREKRSLSLPRSPDAATQHSSHHDARHKAATKSRMNEYMEARTKKRNDKLKKKEEKEHAEHKKKEEYEKEWEKMAQEERERKRKQQQARRTGRRRPASMKTVRVSQMRQQMTKQNLQKEMPTHHDQQQRPRGDTMEEGRSRRHSQHRNESKTSGSEEDGDQDGNDDESKPAASAFQPAADSPPLPPEPTEADTELYIRQQARLRERHEMEMKRKQEAEEADQVRGQIHRKVEMWAFGKELLHMILTLDQISNSDALKTCQLMVVQSPDNETVRKAYRYRLSWRNHVPCRCVTDRCVDWDGVTGASSV